jgi:hypothetical protein
MAGLLRAATSFAEMPSYLDSEMRLALSDYRRLRGRAA